MQLYNTIQIIGTIIIFNFQLVKTMERKIGEQFEYDGITLEVVNHLGCEGCHFSTLVNCDNSFCGECHSFNRTDKKPVIFKLVEP